MTFQCFLPHSTSAATKHDVHLSATETALGRHFEPMCCIPNELDFTPASLLDTPLLVLDSVEVGEAPNSSEDGTERHSTQAKERSVSGEDDCGDTESRECTAHPSAATEGESFEGDMSLVLIVPCAVSLVPSLRSILDRLFPFDKY